jgi:hypothetical protein
MASEAVKLAKLQARENEKARLWALATDPRVVSAATLVGGILAVEKIQFSDDEGRNQRLKSAIMAALIYQSLSMAGAKGWPAAAASLVGGVGLGSSGGGTKYSPLQAGEATLLGAGVGSIVPGVGTLIGAGVGLGIDTVYQWVT